MLRTHLASALVALLLLTSPTLAQALRSQPNAPPTVLTPGNPTFDPTKPPTGQYFNAGMPMTGFIPGGSGYAPGNSVSFAGPRGTAVPFNYGGLYGAGGFGLPYSPYGSYAFSPPIYGAYYAPYYLPFTTPIGDNEEPAPPLQGAGYGSVPTLKLSGMAAELNMQFPADARVWLNGRPVAGEPSKSRDLSSPTLAPGTDYSFDVRAEWKADGTTYEYTKSVKVPAGERSKITVLAGTPKK